ncbi:MAG: hypothetical protein IPL84_10835 [Chitinophagaceae bacterium]|nr:hypothetical protein [Chitinophagaceae bacterium]
MKKLVACAIMVSVLSSCNNGSDETGNTAADSTGVTTESPLMDAVITADSAGKVIEAGKDSAIKAIKNVKEVIKP